MTNKLIELLTAPNNPRFPITHEDPDRRQVQLDTARFILLIRHPTYLHWNGYVPMPTSEWKLIHRTIPEDLYDYLGPGSDKICWQDMPGVRAVDLWPDTTWVGVSAYRTEHTRASVALIAQSLESLIWRARNAHSAHRG